MEFFSKYPILIPAIAIVIAEILKLVITSFQERRIRWRDFARPGGMPSGHSTLAASIVMIVFMKKGIHSLEFAISAVFAFLVVYDSIKVRYEAGKHAAVLNYLLGEKKLEERLGHTFLEMLAGIFLGVGISFLLLSV